MTGNNTASIISTLQNEIDRNLSPLIPSDKKFALLDFQNHGNVGDSAIWLGEIGYFKKIHKTSPSYVCTIRHYSSKDLNNALPKGPIFLSGGGNFGDIWPHHQSFREKILKEYPDRPIIQLPQSIHFQNPEALKKAAQIINAHSDFTLLVRDKKSLVIAQKYFSCNIALCPDMAFCIGSLQKPMKPIRPLLFLLRTDDEKCVQNDKEGVPLPPNSSVEDWLKEDTKFLNIAARIKTLLSLLFLRPEHLFNKNQYRELLYQNLSQNRVNRGLRQLTSANFVITDRLHTHILSLLLDLPHIFLDNSYGKISNFAKAWTKESTIARSCQSLDQALELYRKDNK